ncbi:MAG TPA: DUF1918 domain-containing protein [Acidimicrobiia bacterium]
MHANVGDEIVVDAIEVGGPPRKGEILEVRSEDGHEHYLVRWDDGHESIFYPGSTSHAVHPGKTA